jgi:peptidoglycan/xylan/chitin deacetylase (PgdA/CDA1 family)
MYTFVNRNMYLIKTPFFLKKLYPSSLIWNQSRTHKVIYLTFDDGPIPIVTPWVLKTLKNFNAKATFFCIGENITKHPEIFSQLKAEGHAIGNHTYNHLKGWLTDDETYLENYQKCQKLTKTNLFRPPYGKMKRSQMKLLRSQVESNEHQVMSSKYQIASIEYQDDLQNAKLSTLNAKLSIIMWDVLSGDFDMKLSPEKCLKNVLKHTENGSIVVFHDSLKAWDRLEYVLPRALEVWGKEGYQFKSL